MSKEMELCDKLHAAELENMRLREMLMLLAQYGGRTVVKIEMADPKAVVVCTAHTQKAERELGDFITMFLGSIVKVASQPALIEEPTP